MSTTQTFEMTPQAGYGIDAGASQEQVDEFCRLMQGKRIIVGDRAGVVTKASGTAGDEFPVIRMTVKEGA